MVSFSYGVDWIICLIPIPDSLTNVQMYWKIVIIIMSLTNFDEMINLVSVNLKFCTVIRKFHLSKFLLGVCTLYWLLIDFCVLAAVRTCATWDSTIRFKIALSILWELSRPSRCHFVTVSVRHIIPTSIKFVYLHAQTGLRFCHQCVCTHTTWAPSLHYTGMFD